MEPSEIQELRRTKVQNRVIDMMSQLDFSKHDKRNAKNYVKKILESHYNSCLTSTITAAQWDDMFAIYTPYSGTY
jgi:hypothetical protein